MSKINIITPPDIVYSDTFNVTLIFTRKEIQNEVQEKIIPQVEDMNLFFFNEQKYTKDNIDWLLSVVDMSDLVLVDVDNCPAHIREILSFIIAKPKTYWLTNSEHPVYNHISLNRIYNLDNLKIGDEIVEPPEL